MKNKNKGIYSVIDGEKNCNSLKFNNGLRSMGLELEEISLSLSIGILNGIVSQKDYEEFEKVKEKLLKGFQLALRSE